MKDKFINSFNNIIVVNIKSKNIERVLNYIYKNKIELFNLKKVNYKEINIEIYEKDLNKIKKISILNKVKVIDYKGKLKIKKIISYNKILLLSLFIGFIFLIFLSNIIFKIEVVHTSSKLKELIFNELEKNGIRKYQFKKDFDELEKIKNNILNNNKKSIEWLEIERVGTKYIIRVEDRKINEYSNDFTYQDIIATKDGVIKKIIANNGVKVKKVNDYVKKGDILISGSIYLNDSLKGMVKATGTVYAEVWYKTSIEYQILEEIKEETGNNITTYSINFLNKSINLKRNKYLISNKVSSKLLSNNILPISISIDKIYEEKVINGIYIEGEALLNAKRYSKEKVIEMLKSDEYIISDKVLNYRVDSNIIYLDMFYKVYSNITGTKRLFES